MPTEVGRCRWKVLQGPFVVCDDFDLTLGLIGVDMRSHWMIVEEKRK
jgi:hypothetical protein